MTSPVLLCPYCGTLPPPVVLQRADDAPIDPGGVVVSTNQTDHAEDCPYFAPVEMSVPTRGPSAFQLSPQPVGLLGGLPYSTWD